MRSLPRALAPPHILEQYPAHDEHEREECRPRHALAEGNGGDIRTKTSAPTSRLHFSRGSQGT